MLVAESNAGVKELTVAVGAVKSNLQLLPGQVASEDAARITETRHYGRDAVKPVDRIRQVSWVVVAVKISQ